MIAVLSIADDVHDGSADAWILFNDRRVSVVDEAVVMAQQAYMLFYQRQSGPHTMDDVVKLVDTYLQTGRLPSDAVVAGGGRVEPAGKRAKRQS